MTLDEIIAAARQRAGDIDSAAYRYTTNEYALMVAQCVRSFSVRGATAAINQLVVTTTEGSEAIAPAASDLQGELLATATALRLLQQTYRRRVDDGSLGVSWTSGLDSETTISAASAYQGMIAEVAAELNELILFANAATFGTRAQ